MQLKINFKISYTQNAPQNKFEDKVLTLDFILLIYFLMNESLRLPQFHLLGQLVVLWKHVVTYNRRI